MESNQAVEFSDDEDFGLGGCTYGSMRCSKIFGTAYFLCLFDSVVLS